MVRCLYLQFALLASTLLPAQDFQFSFYAGGGTFSAADQVLESEFTAFQSTSFLPGEQTQLEVAMITRESISFEPVSYFRLGGEVAFPSSNRWTFYTGLRIDRVELRPEENFQTVSQTLTGNSRTITIPEPDPNTPVPDCPFVLFNEPLEGTFIRQVRLGLPFGVRRTLIPNRTSVFLEGIVSTAVLTITDGDGSVFSRDNAGCFSFDVVPLNSNLYASEPVHAALGTGIDLLIAPGWAVQLGVEQSFVTLLRNAELSRSTNQNVERIDRFRPLFLSLSTRYTFNQIE